MKYLSRQLPEEIRRKPRSHGYRPEATVVETITRFLDLPFSEAESQLGAIVPVPPTSSALIAYFC